MAQPRRNPSGVSPAQCEEKSYIHPQTESDEISQFPFGKLPNVTLLDILISERYWCEPVFFPSVLFSFSFSLFKTHN